MTSRIAGTSCNCIKCNPSIFVTHDVTCIKKSDRVSIICKEHGDMNLTKKDGYIFCEECQMPLGLDYLNNTESHIASTKCNLCHGADCNITTDCACACHKYEERYIAASKILHEYWDVGKLIVEIPFGEISNTIDKLIEVLTDS